MCDNSSIPPQLPANVPITTNEELELLGEIINDKNRKQFICVCGKIYKTQSGICKHRHKCPDLIKCAQSGKHSKYVLIDDVKKYVKNMVTPRNKKITKPATDIDANTITSTTTIEDDNVSKPIYQGRKSKITKSEAYKYINQLIEENESTNNIGDLMMEACKKCFIINNNVNNNNNININVTNNFNLHFFLYEQCKDAMNFSEYVRSVPITIEDLMCAKNEGLVKSVSNIIVNSLDKMDIYKRPIHCTDVKRKTLYIKDNHKWSRDVGLTQFRKGMIYIANNEYTSIKVWMDAHPGWETNPRLQEIHSKILDNVLHELQDDDVGQRKIINRVSELVFVDKTNNELLTN